LEVFKDPVAAFIEQSVQVFDFHTGGNDDLETIIVIDFEAHATGAFTLADGVGNTMVTEVNFVHDSSLEGTELDYWERKAMFPL
jgi:hypothetical protein